MRTRLLAALLLALTAGPVLAASQQHEPLAFVRVPAPRASLDLRLDERDAAATAQPVSVRPMPSAVVRPSVRLPLPHVVVRRTAGDRPVTHRVAGTASYYCSPAHPICHYAYPLGSMVAAACGKLRAAIGPHWRGRVVTVRSGRRRVVVTLVDWCGSPTKTIDLYAAPFERLAPLSAGVVRVVVAW